MMIRTLITILSLLLLFNFGMAQEAKPTPAPLIGGFTRSKPSLEMLNPSPCYTNPLTVKGKALVLPKSVELQTSNEGLEALLNPDLFSLVQVMAPYSDRGGRLMDLSILKNTACVKIDVLKRFIDQQLRNFDEDIAFSLAASSARDVVENYLNGLNFKNAEEITYIRQWKSPTKDIYFIQFKLSEKKGLGGETVIFALAPSNDKSTDTILDDIEDSSSPVEISPSGVDDLPPKYLFDFPVKLEDFKGYSMLYGPRTWGSHVFYTSNEIRTVEQMGEYFKNNYDGVYLKWRTRRGIEGIPANSYVLSGYNGKTDTVGWQFHRGTDYRVEAGSEVLAPYDGKVFFSAGLGGITGNTTILIHSVPRNDPSLPPKKLFTIYMHLSRFKTIGDKEVIVKGQKRIVRGQKLPIGHEVKKGDVIAYSGGRWVPTRKKFPGHWTQEHLHFEVREIDASVDLNEINDLASRSKIVWTSTKSISTARFLENDDRECYKRKYLEVQNAMEVEKRHGPKFITPMTAGYCSFMAEQRLATDFANNSIPKIYQIKTSADIAALYTAPVKPTAPVRTASARTVAKKPATPSTVAENTRSTTLRKAADAVPPVVSFVGSGQKNSKTQVRSNDREKRSTGASGGGTP